MKTLIGKTQSSNDRGVGAMRKLGAKVIEQIDRNGVPEYVWTIERKLEKFETLRTLEGRLQDFANRRADLAA